MYDPYYFYTFISDGLLSFNEIMHKLVRECVIEDGISMENLYDCFVLICSIYWFVIYLFIYGENLIIYDYVYLLAKKEEPFVRYV